MRWDQKGLGQCQWKDCAAGQHPGDVCLGCNIDGSGIQGRKVGESALRENRGEAGRSGRPCDPGTHQEGDTPWKIWRRKARLLKSGWVFAGPQILRPRDSRIRQVDAQIRFRASHTDYRRIRPRISRFSRRTPLERGEAGVLQTPALRAGGEVGFCAWHAQRGCHPRHVRVRCKTGLALEARVSPDGGHTCKLGKYPRPYFADH